MSNINRNELKIQALLEKISSLTAQYENQVADLRVELTITASELSETQQKLEELETVDVSVEEDSAKPAK